MNDLLRPMFSYSIIPIIITVIIIIVILFFLLKKEKKEKPPIVIPPKVENRMTIKEKYLKEIISLKNDSLENKITNRKSYQRLSVIIRKFIYEMTHIKVQNYSLEEIRKVNIPILTQLVEEYYDPEFSKNSSGNIINSIDKTREVIERWK